MGSLLELLGSLGIAFGAPGMTFGAPGVALGAPGSTFGAPGATFGVPGFTFGCHFSSADSIGSNFRLSGLDWERFSLERTRLGAIFARAG